MAFIIAPLFTFPELIYNWKFTHEIREIPSLYIKNIEVFSYKSKSDKLICDISDVSQIAVLKGCMTGVRAYAGSHDSYLMNGRMKLIFENKPAIILDWYITKQFPHDLILRGREGFPSTNVRAVNGGRVLKKILKKHLGDSNLEEIFSYW